MPEKHALAMALLRWLHIFAGVTWIGHLYFFNFVNGPFAKTLDAETKKKVIPQLMPRALWWFRWGAMMTLLIGLALFVTEHVVGVNDVAHHMRTFMDGTKGQWVLLGMTLGTIMWFNVWFVIWPAQQKIITWVKNGEKPAEMDATVRRAFLFSRINTYLSGPMLFGMVAATHFADFGLASIGIGVAAPLLIVHLCIGASSKAGANF